MITFNRNIPQNDKDFRNFKTDYLICMTKIQKEIEIVADKLKRVYKLTDDQYNDVIEYIQKERV